MLLKCKCGNNLFFVHTEKMYMGSVERDGALGCLPEEEGIVEIKCTECSKIFNESAFKDIDY
jgi:hypothetical protein